jgi:major intracellular serine protease
MLAQSPRSFDTTGFAHQLQDKDIRTAQALQALGQTSDLQDITARLIKPSTSGTKVNDVAQIKDAATGKLVSDGQRFIPSGIWATGAPTLWAQDITGKTCLVGVIDSGIDKDHPDLKGKVVIERDYVDDNKKANEWNPHGTHVAGTIAANGKVVGVAPHAKLADYRVLNSEGSGSFQAITKAIYQATLDGCNIINLSLGGTVDYRPMHAAIQNAVANGVLVVAAVGNEGDDNPATTEISYPGYYHEVCGAGAVQFSTSADDPNTILDAYFTNTNKEVAVAAPGWKVLSTVPGGQYTEMSGTSMASPHVSGFAALLYDKFTMRNQQVLPPGMLFTMVKSMTVDIDELGIDDTTGAGFITFYPDIPKKRNGNWVFDEFETGKPEITSAGVTPAVRGTGAQRTKGPFIGQKKDIFFKLERRTRPVESDR